MKEKGSIRMQILASLSATLVFVVRGFYISWPSPTLPKLLDSNSTLHITSDEGSWVVSFASIGQLVMPIPTGYLVNVVGRKYTLCATFVPFLLSWLLILPAESAALLYVARLLGGLGMGVAFTVIPMYVGEIAQDHIRGALGTLFQVMINVGGMFQYCVGPYVSVNLLAGLSSVVPILFIVTFIWMPETPYYLLLKNRRCDAERSLMRLRGTQNVESVQDELQRMEKFVEINTTNKGTFKDLFTNKTNLKALMIVNTLALVQQFSGIIAILAYTTIIFESSGSSLGADVSVMILGAVALVMSIVSSVLVDVVGRRPLLLMSCVGSAMALLAEGVYFYLKQNTDTDVSSIDWLPITAIIVYQMVFTQGLGPLPFTVLGEIFPTNVKGLASSLTATTLAAGALIATKVFQVVRDAYGEHVAFWGFAACCVAGTVFVALVVPETKGKTFQRINDELSGKKTGK